MKIKDFLSPDNALIETRASDKVDILQALAHRAATALDLPVDQISNAVLKREELGSTGTGGGIAIPHARISGLNRPFGILARLSRPIDFDAIDGQPVDLLFLLLLPLASGKEQLAALASVARVLRNQKSVRNLRRASTSENLYRAMVTGEPQENGR
jgi:PTS system nitrogen regulatory IIA component